MRSAPGISTLRLASRPAVLWIWLAGPLLLLALACGEPRSSTSGAPGAQAAANPPALAPDAAIPASTLPAPDGKRWLGVLVSRETIDVSPQVSGRVLSVEAAIGDRVTQGQLLARLDRSMVEQDLAMARSSVNASEAELRRAGDERSDARSRGERRRANPDFFSKEDLAEVALREKTAESSYEVAEAHLTEAKARVRQLGASLGQTEVRAPFAGQVAERFAGPGSLVSSGAPILRLLASGEPLVRAAVPPEDAASLKLGQKVALHPRGSETRLAGKVTRIAPDIDAASQMILIEIGLEDPKAQAAGLRTGIVVDVEPG